MIYTIKSKISLDGLKVLLLKNNFIPMEISPFEVQIEVHDEQKTLFYSVISVYLSYNLYVNLTKDFIQTTIVGDMETQEFWADALRGYQHSTYWRGFSFILVADYFKANHMLNADSFMIFNMKGFKNEVQSLLKQLLEREVEEELEEDEVQDLFAEIREKVSHMNLDLSIFEKMHVRREENQLLFKTDNGTLIDGEYLATTLNGIFSFEVQGNATEQWQRDLMLLPTIVMIFPVHIVTIHKKDITEEIREAISQVWTMLPSDVDVSYQDCGGCDRCDE